MTVSLRNTSMVTLVLDGGATAQSIISTYGTSAPTPVAGDLLVAVVQF